MVRVDACVDLVFQSPEPEQDWAAWLAAWAHRLRETMLAHRDGARILAEADLSLNDFFAGIELALDVLQRAGFDGSTAASGVIAVIHYIMGAVFELQADPSFFAYRKGEESPRAMSPPVDEERFPRIAAFFHRTEVLSTNHLFNLLFATGAKLYGAMSRNGRSPGPRIPNSILMAKK